MKAFLVPPLQKRSVLKRTSLDTPLGSMIAIASETDLYCLEFADRKGLEKAVEFLANSGSSAMRRYGQKIKPMCLKIMTHTFATHRVMCHNVLNYIGEIYVNNLIPTGCC